MTPYQQIIHLTRYARWHEGNNRRETWSETVMRYINFMASRAMDRVPMHEKEHVAEEAWKLYDAINSLKVLPSMRALMTAGPALERQNLAAMNCTYLPIRDTDSFAEVLYILMCGSGVGYSVERHNIVRLPFVAPIKQHQPCRIGIEDSREGWADALDSAMDLMYKGIYPTFDASRVRPAGARLKTFGGYASGPEPLLDLLTVKIPKIFKAAQGRRLKPIEVYDICCMIAQVVVVGGVRRSATICLFDHDDKEMAEAKSGSWWEHAPWRAMSNNSAIVEAPEHAKLAWEALELSQSGEPGFVNRAALKRKVEKFKKFHQSSDYEFGVNPCVEAILRPYQACNLTTVRAEPHDTRETLAAKLRLAAMAGAWQAQLDYMPFVRPEWSQVVEEERIQGVSINGIFDCPWLLNAQASDLIYLRDMVRIEAERWSKLFSCSRPSRITLIKPEGTSSQLQGCSSGLHPAHSPFYIRRIRQDGKAPLTQFLKDQGIPWEDDFYSPGTVVFSFPQKAPPGPMREQLHPVDHLKTWMKFNRFWAEQTVSVTVNVKPEQWKETGDFVVRHADELTGVAFLPYDGGSYQQAPFEEVTEQGYAEAMANMPLSIDFSNLAEYERENTTVTGQEMACVGGVCAL